MGGAVKHPEAGKAFDLSDECNKLMDIPDSDIKVIPSDGYGNPTILRQIIEQEKIDAIRQAVHLVEEACQLVDSTMDDQAYDEGQYEAYGKYGFNQLLGNGNPYDGSLFTLIEKLEGQDND